MSKSKINLARVAALVPENETFNADLLSGDAGWLTTAHLVSIEAALETSAGVQGQLATQATDHQAAIDAMQAQLDASATSLTAANEATAAANASVTLLNGQIDKLKKTSAGGFSAIVTPAADAVPGAVDLSKQFLTSVDAEMAKMLADNK